MPRNLINHNNKVRRLSTAKKKLQDDSASETTVEIKKQDGQEFAIAKKSVGNSWIVCECLDKKERLCHVRGKMRKRDWVNEGDIILIGIREYDPNKADIISKLTNSQIRDLKKGGIQFGDTSTFFGEDEKGEEKDSIDFESI
jgi:translation initiation factor 1A